MEFGVEVFNSAPAGFSRVQRKSDLFYKLSSAKSKLATRTTNYFSLQVKVLCFSKNQPFFAPLP